MTRHRHQARAAWQEYIQAIKLTPLRFYNTHKQSPLGIQFQATHNLHGNRIPPFRLVTGGTSPAYLALCHPRVMDMYYSRAHPRQPGYNGRQSSTQSHCPYMHRGTPSPERSTHVYRGNRLALFFPNSIHHARHPSMVGILVARLTLPTASNRPSAASPLAVRSYPAHRANPKLPARADGWPSWLAPRNRTTAIEYHMGSAVASAR